MKKALHTPVVAESDSDVAATLRCYKVVGYAIGQG